MNVLLDNVEVAGSPREARRHSLEAAPGPSVGVASGTPPWSRSRLPVPPVSAHGPCDRVADHATVLRARRVLRWGPRALSRSAGRFVPCSDFNSIEALQSRPDWERYVKRVAGGV